LSRSFTFSSPGSALTDASYRQVTGNHSVGTLWEAWNGGSLDHIALGGGIGAWFYSVAGYARDAWTGRIRLRAPDPAGTGSASVHRVLPEGKTGWSWRHGEGGFEANVSVPLGRTVEAWLEPPAPSSFGLATTRLVVREAMNEGKETVVWAEGQEGKALESDKGRREGAAAAMVLQGGEYRLRAAFEPYE